MSDSDRIKIPRAVRAHVTPSSVDEEQRTVELTWTTGADVLRYDWERGRLYYERLRVDEEAVDLSRLSARAPLLSVHSTYSLSSVLGVVERAWVAEGKGHAVVRFSRRADVEPYWQDVVDGILANVSVGYDTSRAQELDEAVDGYPVVEATRWLPFEISMVPVGADADAQVRALASERTSTGKAPEEGPMATKTTSKKKRSEQQEEDQERADEETTESSEECGCAGEEGCECDQSADEETASESSEERSRGQRLKAALAERQRAKAIRSAVRKAHLGDELADELIDKGVSIDRARARIIDSLASSSGPEPSTIGAGDSSARDGAFRSAVVDGILHRGRVAETKDRDARAFGLLSLRDIAAECLSHSGVSTRGLSPREIATRALIDTADFSHIIATVAARTLRAGYEATPRTFAGVFRQATDVLNFRSVKRIALSDLAELPLVAEGATYTHGVLSDSAESYVLKKYGQILPFTWEAVINDDLDALTRVPQILGAAAAERENNVVWGILTANAALSDTRLLFNATDDNLVTDVLDVAGLEAGRKYFRDRLSGAGNHINLEAEFLIVGSELESKAEKLLFENAIVTSDRANILSPSLRKLKLVVEPRITGTQWYMAASPMRVDTIEYAYLAGEGGPTLDSYKSFDVDDIQFKARLVIGAGAVDRVGLYYSSGTGL